MDVNPATTLILRILSASDGRMAVRDAHRARTAPETGASGPSTEAAPEPASLWSLLTPEEQRFFAEQSSLGPLTYRPTGTHASEAPLPTGRRIDVRG